MLQELFLDFDFHSKKIVAFDLRVEKDAVMCPNSTMDCFRAVRVSRFQIWLILQIGKDEIELTSRQEVCFKQTAFTKWN